MRKITDLTGKKYGMLTIVGFSHISDFRTKYWQAVCECGKAKIISYSCLKAGKGLHCGCLPRKTGRVIDITGMVYGELTVLQHVRTSAKEGAVWTVRCSCGQEKEVPSSRLRQNHTRSCGCKRIEWSSQKRRKHGETAGDRWSDRYYLWSNAKHRAAKRGMPFDISLDDIVIPDICPLLGIPLVKGTFDTGPLRSSPTLDKLVPEKGYTKGNVWVISYKANTMKSDASLKEIQTLSQNLEKKFAELNSNTSENKQGFTAI